MASPISVDVFPAIITSTPKRLYVQSIHSVNTNAVFLVNVPSGLNTGRFVFCVTIFVGGCLLFLLNTSAESELLLSFVLVGH